MPGQGEVSEEALKPADPAVLKQDQRRAFDIAMWHLDQTLAGNQPPPLRMVLHGEGGTGKSKVIQTITAGFQSRQAEFRLLKAAYTGIAASLIDGKTTHTISMISLTGRAMSEQTKAKLQTFWTHYDYLIIDEYSMLAKTFLAKLSRNIGIGKAKETAEETLVRTEDGRSFGGISVILCGDLHQFPPVATAKREALYYPPHMTDSVDMALGRMIYEEFSTVVVLREQVRVTDEVWHDFLQHLRNGRVKAHHTQMLRTLIVTGTNNQQTDFNIAPWKDACLVTPRHAVRQEWNEMALEKHCKDGGHQLFICRAEDTVKGRPLSLAERYGVVLRGCGEGRRRKKADLPEEIALAIGMKVMVTQNIETDLDIANGARGEIVDIVLHPDKPETGNSNRVVLRHLPAYVLVKMNRTRAAQLEGLEAAVIPVVPVIKTFTIKVSMGTKQLSRTVKRRQLPMTAAYGFTDYRAQGQTMTNALVDIANPPSGSLSLFNLYVALSRSSGRGSIRLLRDFDDNIFMKAHDPELLAEDDRLDTLDRGTKSWAERMFNVEREEQQGLTDEATG